MRPTSKERSANRARASRHAPSTRAGPCLRPAVPVAARISQALRRRARKERLSVPLDGRTLSELRMLDETAVIGPDAPAAAPGTEKRRRKAREGPAGARRVKRDRGRESKGIETMYRNAYRAELDLIALAATKANIMISLNGFIISALMISGNFIYASSPLLLLPAALFLFTSALSVYFALLAASPEQIGTLGKVRAWLRALARRETSPRGLARYVRRDPEFVDGESNILVYEDRVKLSEAVHREKMRELRGDREAIYDRMSDQLYWLGRMSSAKFRMLDSSYGVFRWGLVLSVLAFLGIEAGAR